MYGTSVNVFRVSHMPLPQRKSCSAVVPRKAATPKQAIRPVETTFRIMQMEKGRPTKKRAHAAETENL